MERKKNIWPSLNCKLFFLNLRKSGSGLLSSNPNLPLHATALEMVLFLYKFTFNPRQQVDFSPKPFVSRLDSFVNGQRSGKRHCRGKRRTPPGHFMNKNEEMVGWSRHSNVRHGQLHFLLSWLQVSGNAWASLLARRTVCSCLPDRKGSHRFSHLNFVWTTVAILCMESGCHIS